MRTLRNTLWLRGILFGMVAAMAWLGVGPAYGAGYQALLRERQVRQWEAAHPPVPFLAPGLTDTPDGPLWQRINARRAALHAAHVSAGMPADPVSDAVADLGGAADQAQARAATPHRAGARPLLVASRPLEADSRPLTVAEMRGYAGRGPLRSPYLSGAPMPWHRSLRDVNLCTGNLFKSFTDIQVAPARGAGLVLQRTYNSNDAARGRVRGRLVARLRHPHPGAAERRRRVGQRRRPRSARRHRGGAGRRGRDQRGTAHGLLRGTSTPTTGTPTACTRRRAYLYDEMSSAYTDATWSTGRSGWTDDSETWAWTGRSNTTQDDPDQRRRLRAATSGAATASRTGYGNADARSPTGRRSYVQPDGSTRQEAADQSVTDPVGRSLTVSPGPTWGRPPGSALPHRAGVDAPTGDPTTSAPASPTS